MEQAKSNQNYQHKIRESFKPVKVLSKKMKADDESSETKAGSAADLSSKDAKALIKKKQDEVPIFACQNYYKSAELPKEQYYHVKKKIEKEFSAQGTTAGYRVKGTQESKPAVIHQPKAADADYNRDIHLYKKKEVPKTYDEEYPPLS